jgi:hypothetical protein
MNRLAAMVSPSSAVASSVASTSSGDAPSSAVFTASMICCAGNCMSGFIVNVPGIAS